MADLKDLTRAEALLILRRRRGENQIEAAARHRVPVSRYREWEANRGGPPATRLGGLSLREVVYLARRRAGMTQREVAEQIGCSKLWVVQMENGPAPVDRLRDYWKV